MSVLGFPLLIISLALYNIVALLLDGFEWSTAAVSIAMPSQAPLTLSFGDLLIAISVLLLSAEIVKATRLAPRNVVDHVLSLLLFGGMVLELVLVQRAATSTFLLLLVISSVDVIAGFMVSSPTARPDVATESVVPSPKS